MEACQVEMDDDNDACLPRAVVLRSEVDQRPDPGLLWVFAVAHVAPSGGESRPCVAPETDVRYVLIMNLSSVFSIISRNFIN